MVNDRSPLIPAVSRESLILLLYTALTLFATRPILERFTTAIPGGDDGWGYLWDLWWIKRSLSELRSPFHTQLLYFPYGAQLYFHTLNLLPSYLVQPVVSLAGLAAGYNTLVIGSFVSTAYVTYRFAMYVLSRQGTTLQSTRGAALLAGAIFTFSSYRVAHLLGHLDLLNTQWLPLFALSLLKVRDGNRRWIVLCGMSLAAAAFTAWYYAICLLPLVALVAMEAVFSRADWPVALRGIGLAMLVFLVFVSPVLVPMLLLGGTQGRTPDPLGDAIRFSPDLLAFVTPSYVNGVWSSWAGSIYRTFGDRNGGIEQIAFLGFIPLGLGLVALATSARSLRLWVVSLVTYCLLALGPVLHIAGHPLPAVSFFMPYRWLMWLPYSDIPRVPGRFVVMAVLALSVLAGEGARHLLTRRKHCDLIGMPLLALVAILENAGKPVAVQSIRSPVYFEETSYGGAGGGVLEVPIPDDPASFPKRMLWQTAHGQPVFGGYLARGLPPIPFDAVPGFSQLKSARWEVDDIVRYDPETLLASSRSVLSAYRARFIVLEKTLLPSSEADRLRSIADTIAGAGTLVHDDETIRAYRLAEDTQDIGPTIWLDRGWSYLELGG